MPTDPFTTNPVLGIGTDTDYDVQGDAYDGTPVQAIPSAGVLAQGLRPERQVGAQHRNWIDAQFAALLVHLHDSRDPLADIAALKAVDISGSGTTPLVRLVKETGSNAPAFYLYEAASAATASVPDVIAPNAGSGRWHLIGFQAMSEVIVTAEQDVTVPPWAHHCFADYWGGGGGGGAGGSGVNGTTTADDRWAPGGGAGGTAIRKLELFNVTPGATIHVTPGVGGSGGAGASGSRGADGSDGGDTTIGSLGTAPGAEGGQGGGGVSTVTVTADTFAVYGGGSSKGSRLGGGATDTATTTIRGAANAGGFGTSGNGLAGATSTTGIPGVNGGVHGDDDPSHRGGGGGGGAAGGHLPVSGSDGLGGVGGHSFNSASGDPGGPGHNGTPNSGMGGGGGGGGGAGNGGSSAAGGGGGTGSNGRARLVFLR